MRRAPVAVLALAILPDVLGPIGAIRRFVGYAKCDKPFGRYVGIVATDVGYVVFSSCQ